MSHGTQDGPHGSHPEGSEPGFALRWFSCDSSRALMLRQDPQVIQLVLSAGKALVSARKDSCLLLLITEFLQSLLPQVV